MTGDDAGPAPVPPALGAAGPPPVAPTAPLPLAEVATVARPHPLVRALLLSGLILLAGAALGAGGFVLEQAQATWRPQVTATSSGWHISTSHGLRLGGAGLGGERLAWEAGPFTVLTDLRSGRSRLLGAASSAGSSSPPSLSDRFVVWLQAPAYGASGAAVWVYDIARGRRTRLEGIHGISQSPAVSGTTAVWETFAGGGAQQIDGVDLVTRRRFSLGPSGGASQLVISGSLVAWVAPRPDPPAPPLITVVDLADGHRWHVAPYPLSQGSDVLGIALAGRTLVWGRSTPADDEILTYDLDTAAVRMIAQGVGHAPLAADGDLVVWAQPSPAGDTRIVGLRLSGGQPFTIVALPVGMVGRVRDVYISGKTIAWNVAGSLLFDSYLQTTRLP